MNRRHDGGVDQSAVSEGQEIESVVDDVELVGVFEGVCDVQAFGDLWINVVIFGPTAGNGGSEVGFCEGVRGGE